MVHCFLKIQERESEREIGASPRVPLPDANWIRRRPLPIKSPRQHTYVIEEESQCHVW